jgi:hypothetical protein
MKKTRAVLGMTIGVCLLLVWAGCVSPVSSAEGIGSGSGKGTPSETSEGGGETVNPPPPTPPNEHRDVVSMTEFTAALMETNVDRIYVKNALKIELKAKLSINGDKTISGNGSTITTNGNQLVINGNVQVQNLEITADTGPQNGPAIQIAAGRTLTLDKNASLVLAANVSGDLASEAKIEVRDGGIIHDKGSGQIWNDAGTGSLEIHYGGTGKVGDNVIVGTKEEGKNAPPLELAESGSSVVLTKTSYTINGKVTVNQAFGVADGDSLKVSAGAELTLKAPITLQKGASAVVQQGGFITVEKDGGKLVLEDNKDNNGTHKPSMALRGTITVKSGGEIHDKDTDQVWKDNAEGSIIIETGGKGYVGSQDKLFVGSASDSNPDPLLKLADNSTLTIENKRYTIKGTLKVCEDYTLPGDHRFTINANSTLEIADGKKLTIEDNDVHFSGVNATSVIKVGKQDAAVYLSQTKILPEGTYSWISSANDWKKTS